MPQLFPVIEAAEGEAGHDQPEEETLHLALELA